jgi:hypothetical protein
MRRSRNLSIVVTALSTALAMLLGCASNTDNSKKPTTRTSDKAMKDPYGDWTKVDEDISSSKKGSVKEDWDHFWLK